MEPVRVAFVVHNHQPVGNFEHVFEAAYRDGYLPFLELLEQHEHFRVVMHISGPLLEWLQKRQPTYLERLRALVQRSQVEILGGAYYEPILSMIPIQDRFDQIRLYRDRLEELFDTDIRGMWLAERVWEPGFVSVLARAGVEYTLLDDFHFRVAGLGSEELRGYYLTEDEGLLLKVFPISELLRYYIPFKEPQETIDYCRRQGQQGPGTVLVFGDDGEKFGVWPETRKHVYEDRWLPRFIDSLRHNADWLQTCTLAQIVETVPPLGTVYLPDCAYREMTEWALPTERARELKELQRQFQNDPRWSRVRPFIRGASWRNFKVKYPETKEMYCRMLEVSRAVQELSTLAGVTDTTAGEGVDGELVGPARRELHRAQCNCAYWHGWFGGVYLPHLRHAVFEHLLRAEELCELAMHGPEGKPSARIADYNLDARMEVKLSNRTLAVYIAPAMGGMVYELDVRSVYFNALAVMSRRPELYHEELVERIAQDDAAGLLVTRTEPNGSPQLVYDAWRRAFGIDHVYRSVPSLQQLATNRAEELLDNPLAAYPDTCVRKEPPLECLMQRIARVGDSRIRLSKRYVLEPDDSALSLTYEIELLDSLPEPCSFAPEFTLAAMAGNTPDRYLKLDSGSQTPYLSIPLEASRCGAVSVCDEHMGLTLELSMSRVGGLVSVPLETVSQSEAGYERVFQGIVLHPIWPLPTNRGERFEVTVTLRAMVARPAGQPNFRATAHTARCARG